MHIPDGFLSAPVWAALDALAIPAVGIAVRKSSSTNSQAPLLGVMGAFVFAAQMVNFPVGLGTSGHLVGGALLAVTLGPGAASIVMTAILVLQALVFRDGGLLALGANVVNMAVVGVWMAWLPYRLLSGNRLGIFAAGFLSVMASSACALAELQLSGVAFNGTAVGISILLFLVTAVLEGLITVTVMQSISKLNSGWKQQPERLPAATIRYVLLAAGTIVLAAVFIASGLPDGLQSFLSRVGVTAGYAVWSGAPLPNYEASFLSAEWSRKAFAGFAGLSTIYVVCLWLGRLITRQRNA